MQSTQPTAPGRPTRMVAGGKGEKRLREDFRTGRQAIEAGCWLLLVAAAAAIPAAAALLLLLAAAAAGTTATSNLQHTQGVCW